MAKDTTLQIDALKRGRLTVRLIGDTPLYYNAMSLKAKNALFLGGGKKTAAERKEIKHNPEEEYRDSVYKTPHGPTLLCFPAPGIKQAMATAALETPGVTKSSVQRLIFLPEQKIRIWGKPYLKCDVVRSADINRTPDIRTRAFLPRWAAEVTVAFVTPSLSAYSIVSLLANAGMIVGIGDFRQEKGHGSYGTFSVYGEQMDKGALALWKDITREGRSVQEAALNDPEFADDDTSELMQMMYSERSRRAA